MSVSVYSLWLLLKHLPNRTVTCPLFSALPPHPMLASSKSRHCTMFSDSPILAIELGLCGNYSEAYVP